MSVRDHFKRYGMLYFVLWFIWLFATTLITIPTVALLTQELSAKKLPCKITNTIITEKSRDYNVQWDVLLYKKSTDTWTKAHIFTSYNDLQTALEHIDNMNNSDTHSCWKTFTGVKWKISHVGTAMGWVVMVSGSLHLILLSVVLFARRFYDFDFGVGIHLPSNPKLPNGNSAENV